jgi:hypothetical protein
MTAPGVADNRDTRSRSRLADRPDVGGESSLNAQAGDPSNEAGEPDRVPGENLDAWITGTMGETTGGRATSDEDEEEEERRRRQLAGELAGSGPGDITDATLRTTQPGALTLPESRSSGSVPGGVSSAAQMAGRAPMGRSQNPSTADAVRPGEIASAGEHETGPAGQPSARRESTARPAADAPDAIADSGSGSAGGATEAPRVNDSPQPVGPVVGATGTSPHPQMSAGVAPLERSSAAGIQLNIDARPGPAGVGTVPGPDPGIDSRRASRLSPAIQPMAETRFQNLESGGTPSVNGAPTIASEAFRSRNPGPGGSSGGPQTEEAIELGLAFLARHQQEDGSWTLGGFDLDRNDRASMMSSDMAATGLALLAFQGAGYNHREFRYADRMSNAIGWMLDNQQEDGQLFVLADENSNKYARLYSHAIATLALAEAYGMTQDEQLRQPVQRALDYIARTQDRELGGWRYTPGTGSDTSVTGWMLMALQSGRVAGLETDPDTFEFARKWLDQASDASMAHLFRYNPAAMDTEGIRRSHGRVPTPCMTSVGLLMRLYIDWERDDPRFRAGAQYLLQNLPDDSTMEKRDTYYWYYATQILRHLGGDEWEVWHNSLHPLLVDTQIKVGDMAGSWHPMEPVPDRWGPFAGRLYVTTMNLLSLEVDYRLLPLYEEMSEPREARAR